MIHFATRNALLALLAAVVFLAPPAAAQTADLELQARPSVQGAYQAAQTSVSDAFVLTNSAGDTLFVAADNGKVFVGPPDKYFSDRFDENFYSHMTRPSGNAGAFYTTNVENSSQALYVRTEGPGITGYFRQANDTTRSAAVLAQTTSMGAAGGFEIYNSQNDYSAVFGLTTGLGPGGNFNIRNASNDASAVLGLTNGTGSAGFFQRTGTGSSYGPAVQILQEGTADFAPALHAQIQNEENTSPAIDGFTNGTGSAARLGIGNADNSSDALYVSTVGTGFAAAFDIKNESNGSPAVSGYTEGTGPAGSFTINNASNGSNALYVSTNGTGPAGSFTINNASNTAAAVRAETNGSGDLAHFVANGNLRVNIQNDGDISADGTFNGGGADIAEAFEVEGAVTAYEPGDVLVISTERDRTVTRSGAAYSTRVVGVYATKPGVLLSEKGMATNWDERVPMGVIGVIPTKVTLEGGAIQRGDLLVTSSTAGHAMKANLDNVGFGQVIGKALQPYDGTGPALIEVLVNVK
jgi:hypothetical protein